MVLFKRPCSKRVFSLVKYTHTPIIKYCSKSLVAHEAKDLLLSEVRVHVQI